MAQNVAEILEHGEMTVHGRVNGSSNATLLVSCTIDGTEVLGIYKPERGERPLWDFPSGLYRREVAAYVVSEALSWGLVPVTVLREDAPYGVGSVQLVVDDDGESHYLTRRNEEKFIAQFRRLATFDVIVNNADRKSGHVLFVNDEVWAIDHGLTFHVEDKLRTVIWEFAGEELEESDASDLKRLRASVAHDLEALLSPAELGEFLTRIDLLLEEGTLPFPRDEYCLPWPLV
jgi:uncharacterized repeat protein (TIGR03843 family)